MPSKDHALAATTTSKKDEHRTMKAVQWMGTKDIAVGEVPKPVITDPKARCGGNHNAAPPGSLAVANCSCSTQQRARIQAVLSIAPPELFGT